MEPILKKQVEGKWYNLLKSGKKKYEGRLNKGDFMNLKIGDNIIFYNNDDEFKVKVIDIIKFINFQEMLEKIGLSNVLPGIDNIQDGIKIYRKYFSEEQEEKYGVIAIKISIID